MASSLQVSCVADLHYSPAATPRSSPMLPPRSPKLNGHVERANRTHREEFYEVEEIDLSIEEHNRQLEEWEYVYNHIRPHQALDYLTPNEYYQLWLKNQKSECH